MLYKRICDNVRMGTSIKNIPLLFLDEHICYIAVKKNPSEFQYVPKRLQNVKICKKAVRIGTMIQYIEPHIFSKVDDICSIAVKHNKDAFHYITPEMLKTQRHTMTDLYDILIIYHGISLNIVPANYISNFACMFSLIHCRLIPEDLYTDELLNLILDHISELDNMSTEMNNYINALCLCLQKIDIKSVKEQTIIRLNKIIIDVNLPNLLDN